VAENRGVMLAGFCCLMVIGCNSSPSPHVVDTTEFLRSINATLRASAEESRGRDDEILTAIHEVKAIVESTAQAREEVIPESDSAPGEVIETASLLLNDSPGVPIWVTNAPFHCPPCERLRRDFEAGKLDGFDVHFIDDPNYSPRSYPAIRFRWPSSPTGYGVRHGWDAGQLAWLRQNLLEGTETAAAMSHAEMVALHNRLHGGGSWTWPGDLATHLRDTHGVQTITGAAPTTGAMFPHSTTYQVTSKRPAVRSVSRRPSIVGRARNLARKSCPSGGCPR